MSVNDHVLCYSHKLQIMGICSEIHGYVLYMFKGLWKGKKRHHLCLDQLRDNWSQIPTYIYQKRKFNQLDDINNIVMRKNRTREKIDRYFTHDLKLLPINEEGLFCRYWSIKDPTFYNQKHTCMHEKTFSWKPRKKKSCNS